ncbi:hypothetical protein Slin15195_G125170 [Septoria linicola]|uniref:Uncharacterized protein n=1 Tax=Septoria linicola TaxID=215465 RepID=A0A9Q9B585_9PEZI|nr:hypothetical protein Slin14017_G081360 [Septoria linicola]USW59198.1 hypothetical protein Slin15195_G125170 [Septoria linicola]
MEQSKQITEVSPLLTLSKELRLMIYSFLLPVSRPFLIGRLEDPTLSGYDFDERSPRDYHANSEPPLHRNNEKHRPIQTTNNPNLSTDTSRIPPAILQPKPLLSHPQRIPTMARTLIAW